MLVDLCWSHLPRRFGRKKNRQVVGKQQRYPQKLVHEGLELWKFFSGYFEWLTFCSRVVNQFITQSGSSDCGGKQHDDALTIIDTYNYYDSWLISFNYIIIHSTVNKGMQLDWFRSIYIFHYIQTSLFSHPLEGSLNTTKATEMMHNFVDGISWGSRKDSYICGMMGWWDDHFFWGGELKELQTFCSDFQGLKKPRNKYIITLFFLGGW